MAKDEGLPDGERETATEPKADAAEAARPGRPPRNIGRRRLLAGGLTVGPVLLTLGTTSRAAQQVPVGTACHSNSLSRLASFHPGETHCPNVSGH
jgi:hypothetical protein